MAPQTTSWQDHRVVDGHPAKMGSELRLRISTAPSDTERNTHHRSSLLNDSAREALIGPYRSQTAALLTVASSGALIFLMINFVGVLLCKGYFRKRTPSSLSSTFYLQSLSQSRRSRYATLLRRFSLESYTHSIYEQSTDGLFTGVDRVVVGRWPDLSPPGVRLLDTYDGQNDARRSPLDGFPTTTTMTFDLECGRRVGNRMTNRPRMKKGKRSRSFDESLLYTTARLVSARGQGSLHSSNIRVQIKKC